MLVAFVSMGWSEDTGEDRIGTILSMMADMRTHVESLTESVKKIEQNEGDVAKKVEKLVQNEGEMAKKVGNIDTWNNLDGEKEDPDRTIGLCFLSFIFHFLFRDHPIHFVSAHEGGRWYGNAYNNVRRNKQAINWEIGTLMSSEILSTRNMPL